MKLEASMINPFSYRNYVAVSGARVKPPTWISFMSVNFFLRHQFIHQPLLWWNVAFPTGLPGRYIVLSPWA